jgi:hypothetical protein
MNAIVTTTINEPSMAIHKFLYQKDWTVIIVGDKKTPHDEYKKLYQYHPNLIYLDCEEQDKLYPELSAVIGWKTIQRRNLGFVHAYNLGAKVIATIDDDNVPYGNWGWNCVNKYNEFIDLYDCETEIFDPLSVTEHNYLWHRGFPLQLVKNKNKVTYMGTTNDSVGIQADLWDGDPDVDAFQRITIGPCVKFDKIKRLYKGPGLSVFDSQNTFLSRECFPFYFVMPFVGRMDDIFGGYYMQIMRPDLHVAFGPPSVYQQRNAQDLVVNMKKEYIGYENALEFIHKLKYARQLSDCIGIIPREVLDFQKAYTDAFKI